MILIPLAHRLDATAVLSIIMALFVFCVLWESVTSLRSGAHLWEKWEDTDYPDESHGSALSKENGDTFDP